MRKLQRILQPLSPLFLPQLPPIPDTCLDLLGISVALNIGNVIRVEKKPCFLFLYRFGGESFEMMENHSNDRRWSVHRARVTNDCYAFMLFWNGASFLNHFEPKSRWLFDSKEAPQSFQDYVMERPPAPQRAHNRIYLLPLTEAGGGHDKVGSLPDLRPLQRFIEAFFDLTCKVLPYDPLLTGKLGGGFTIFWHVFGLHVRPLWGVEFPIWSPLCQRKVKIPDVSHPKCKQEIWRAGHHRHSWLVTYLHPIPLVRTIRGTRKIDKIWMCLRNCHSFFLGGCGPSKLSTGHHIPQQLRKGIASRSNGHGNDLQYHAKDSLRQLRIRLPMDGFCILGVTMCDLFDSTHSFVHSSVSVPWTLKRKSGRTMEDYGGLGFWCNELWLQLFSSTLQHYERELFNPTIVLSALKMAKEREKTIRAPLGRTRQCQGMTFLRMQCQKGSLKVVQW